MASTAEKTRKKPKTPEEVRDHMKDLKKNPEGGTPNKKPADDRQDGTVEAWGLEHSSRGGDLWHAVKFEIKRKGIMLYAKEVDRFPATLKAIATEHIRDNISRLKL